MADSLQGRLSPHVQRLRVVPEARRAHGRRSNATIGSLARSLLRQHVDDIAGHLWTFRRNARAFYCVRQISRLMFRPGWRIRLQAHQEPTTESPLTIRQLTIRQFIIR
jgi:hypothetical protein